MQEQLLIVKYIPAKNCFLHLPQSLHRQYFIQDTCIKVKTEHKTLFLSCNPQPLMNSDATVGLCSTFARALGINDGDPILCTVVSHCGVLGNIHVMPLTDEDWDILETNADKIETTFMDQIRVVSDKQIITIWCSKTMHLKFQIVSMQPNLPVGYVGNNTEVVVIHPSEKSTYGSNITDQSWSLSNLFTNFNKPAMPDDTVNENEKHINELNIIFKKYNKKGVDVYRIIPTATLDISPINITQNNRYVYIDDHYLPENHKCSNVYRIKKVFCPKLYMKDDTKNNSEKEDNEYFVKLCSAKNLPEIWTVENRNKTIQHFKKCSYASLIVNEDICRILNTSLGHRVTLECVREHNELKSIEISCLNNITNIEDLDLIDLFKEYVVNNSNGYRVLVPNKTILNLEYNDVSINLQVNIIPEEISYVQLNSDCFRSIPINIVKTDTYRNMSLYDLEIFDFNMKNVCEDIDSMMNIVTNSVNSIEIGFKRLATRQNILIEGYEGSGKTTISKLICNQLISKPYLYYAKILECRLFKGRRFETIQKEITNILLEACLRSPAVILLDDLEAIGGISREENPDSQVLNRITDMLYNILSLYQSRHNVSIIATTQSISKLNSKLYAARGRHVFGSTWKIPELEKNDRIKLLEHLLRQAAYLEPNLQWDNYALQTDGYVVQDIVDLAEKAVFKSWKSKSSNTSNFLARTITHSAISEALIECRPLRLSHAGVTSTVMTNVNDIWESIGGLDDVKSTLVELVKWPTMYPLVFTSAPISTSRGALLCGPPGCGKTLLGGALAKHCGLRMISVRGPELLSKYVGQSEQAVRDVFVRAQSARPCILFFDEFDSLAPKRGHSTTGVSDRVVNQLLTQLDGAEALSVGVFVLGATSRPDLVDGALLRPGRLDPILLCPIPDQNRRLGIINGFSNSMVSLNTEAEQIITEVSKLSEGFTGADLRAVLSKAREYSIENNDDQISKENLLRALKNTKPSLSKRERDKYEYIHSNFFGSRHKNISGKPSSSFKISEPDGVLQTSTRSTMA